MKVIQVIGSSGSGKTTFIRKLAKTLTGMGKTGTIKHLGHHRFRLEEGKDTTLHYQSGVFASLGIDDEKSVATIKCNGFEDGLNLLSDLGIEYAVIEGFKTFPFPCIVIGDLESDSCILRDPDVEQVIDSLDRFSDYYTIQGLTNGFDKGHNIITAGIRVKNITKTEPGPQEIADMIESAIQMKPGVSKAICRFSQNPSNETGCQLLIALSVKNAVEGPEILKDVIKFIEEKQFFDLSSDDYNQ